MIDNNVDPCANLIIDRLETKELNKRAIQLCKTIQNNTVLWTMNPNSVHSIIYKS